MLNSASVLQVSSDRENQENIVLCVRAKIRSEMARYPNYFEDTYLNNFTKTLDGEESSLHRSILDQRVSLLDVLLEDQDVDVNVRNKNFESALLAAVKVENKALSYKMVKRLLRHKKLDINLADYNGDTPLHEAVKLEMNDNLDKIISLLLDRPTIEINAKNCLGKTPLHLAKTTVAARKLLDAGADVNRRDFGNNIPLHQQVTNAATVQLLISRGSEINCRSFHGFTPLHEAACHNTEDTMEVLLEAGADANIQNDPTHRITPLAMSYRSRASDYMKERLWLESKNVYLLFPVSYDASKIPIVLEQWNSTIPDQDVAEFIINLIDLLKKAEDLRWVTCGRVIGDYFLPKISFLDKYQCQRILKKFSRYMGSSMLNFMLKTQDYAEPNSFQGIKSMIYALLEKGERLDYSDLGIIFTEFGDSALLHDLMKRPVYPRTAKHRDLPFFVKALANLSTTLEKLLAEKRFTTTDEMDFYSVHCLARYCTLPPKVVQNFRHTYEFLRRFKNLAMEFERFERVAEEMEKMPKVRTLLELSRDALRPHLSRVYKTNRTCDLHSILNQIGLPRVLIDMVMMNMPLYRDIEPPQYKPYTRHTYLL